MQYVEKVQTYLSTGTMNMKPKFYMDVYSAFVSMCDEHDKGSDLYHLYKEIMRNYINQEILPHINSKVGDSAGMLKEYVSLFKKFNIFTFSMKKMFDYLDRYYLKNGNNLEGLAQSALNLFKTLVFNIREQEFVNSILQEIHKERENEITDKELIREAIQQFIFMGFENKIAIKKGAGSTEI